MNNNDFNAYQTTILAEAMRQLDIKGKEYTIGQRDADQLRNGKMIVEIFKTLGINNLHGTVFGVYTVFFLKHIFSVMNYAKDVHAGSIPETSEPIDGRIVDAINYLILLGAVLKEQTENVSSNKKE